LAQKIILELKDKLMKTDLPKNNNSMSYTPNPAISDVQTVMLSLGYDNEEIETALKNVMSTVGDSSNTEEILRKALTSLSL
jgi:Holliday junction resolvasome RuvABC DNA-binding subunit